MTKIFRNILISLCGAFAFLFAGIFFSGCKVDYSKISLTSDVSSVQLEVGQTADVIFTIENYKKGFSNKIQVNPRSDETEAVFEAPASSIKYLNSRQIRVTIKAIAGGNGRLNVKTLEAGKECTVDVSVTQYSTSMATRDELLYVTNNSDFVPAPNMFIFDNHTTYTKLSHYYFNSRFDFDERTFKISEIDEENGKLSGFDSTSGDLEADIVKFDTARLYKKDGKDTLSLFLNGENVFDFDALPNDFKMISIYDRSVNNVDYEEIVYSFSDVYVLPSLNVKVFGGYLNEKTNQVDFQPLTSDRIVIVPNSPAENDMKNFILKLEMIDAVVDSEISFVKATSNNFVDVDLYDEYMDTQEENGNVVHYWKISQNSQSQNTTKLDFSIFYKLAAEVFDESVNVSLSYKIDIEIAPTAITVNGTPEPETFYLYNEYENDRFGWQEVFVDVVSGFNSSPNYEGVYLTFDQTNIDVRYGDNDIVVSGNSRIYSDLSKSFYIRGKGDLNGGVSLNTTVTVHLVSEVLQGANQLSLNLNCVIVKGATAIQRSEDYSLADVSKFILDADAGAMSFEKQLYADQMFQDVTYRCQSSSSVVEIELNKQNPYIEMGGRYYLNLKVTPISVGDAVYTIYLDNGTSTTINFSVIKTLKPESTRVYLLDSGNEAVSEFSYSRSEGAEFDNVLNLEILNSSTKDTISFGSVAYVGFDANIKNGGLTFVSNNSQYISVIQTNKNYRLTTLANGNAIITFTLRGDVVDDFRTKEKELEVFVYASSYSLVEEFYLQNGSQKAMENIVYYGNNTKLSDKMVSLTAVANNSNSTNFNQFFFAEEFAEIFDYDESQGLFEAEGGYTYNLRGDEYYTQLQTEKFDKKFVYFYALRRNGNVVPGGVSTKVKITKYWLNEGRLDSLEKTIDVVSPNGLMFLARNFTYEKKDGQDTIATYDVEFSNIYNVGLYGTFDIETFTYTNDFSSNSISFVLEANISQRKLTRRYNARIISEEYVSVENISLASNLTEINLSSKKQTHSFGVYIYPSNATNKTIIAQFIPSTNYLHETPLINCTIEAGESGVYTVTVSCERFYNEYGDRIVGFEDDLSGTLYIFPADWGNSYTTIGGKGAIVIDVQYCNGSEANPYVLETAEDVLEINSNEIMLRSHYRLVTNIDMSSVNNALPIGVLEENGELRFVGFSGSIIGTTSQAAITNIAVSNKNFYAELNGEIYAGLFAQIGSDNVDDYGQTAKIVNVSFSGKVNITTDKKAYVSVLTSRNRAKLENIGVTVLVSDIKAGESLVFGAVAAENLGLILQDFSVYDGSNKSSKYNGLTSKNLAYYNDFVEIVTNGKDVVAGGIVGANNGTIQRVLSTLPDYKLYGYSGYSAVSKIRVSGNASVTNQIYVGGGVGKVSNEKTPSKISGDLQAIRNYINNLLVGGEISTIDIVGDVRDAIGGVVGYVTTDGLSAGNVRDIMIHNNISRCFIRGVYNVGGIAGCDSYKGTERSEINFGMDNRLEAVDLGAAVYDASMIIKRSDSFCYNKNSSSNRNSIEAFYAIGNAMSNSPVYTSYRFTAISYVKRSLLGGVVSSTNTSTNDYYGDYIALKSEGDCYSYEFTKQDVSLGTLESDFKMNPENADEGGLNVYMMYYFAVSSRLSGSSENLLKDEIARLNYITPNSKFYPFSLTSQEVSISSASNELAVDVNGNITVKDVGLAYITLSSILNVKVEQKIYLYIVNYFDKDFDFSVFYSRPSSDGVNVVNGSGVNIYGNTNTSIYLVPPYSLGKTEGVGDEVVTADGEPFSITKNGILNYRNVSYVMANNTQLMVDATADGESKYSTVQTGKQTVVFVKSDKADDYNGEYVGDYYTLKPMLKVEIPVGDKVYVYYFPIDSKATINIEVKYNDSAESIKPSSSMIRIKTNEPYQDNIQVKSTNKDEVLFYQIFQVVDGEQELIQNRLPSFAGQYEIDSDVGKDTWTDYINTITSEDLFGINFIKNGNDFNYACRVNDTSKRFLNRANENIYGQYKVYLYASELELGVSAWFTIELLEAEVNYIDMTNYSNQNDLSVPDEIVVPSQTGLLEVAIDPVEANFNRIEISNSAENYLDGATEASLIFVYELSSENGVRFVSAQNFGTYQNGKLVFTYKEMQNFFNVVNDTLNRENGITNQNDPRYRKYVEYKGKVYVSYYMPSNNVDDAVRVGFEASVYFGKNDERRDYKLGLVTKLGSYARLKFDNKKENDGVYYVARGLSYSLTMESYGFSNDQITVTASDNSIVSIYGENGKYTLDVTSSIINYGGENNPGKKVEITTYAEKVVDNVVIPFQETITLYVMEYVLDYVYVPGVNEDIVSGMEDGTIYTAVGNPYELQFAIRPFLEYDITNSSVNEEVELFIAEMTKNLEWAVYYNDVKTVLANDKTIRTDYYNISSYTVTPLRIYNPQTNIYRFSARANYRAINGSYYYTDLNTGVSQMYTEFVFDVHEQSTQDSPIPVESYEDFMKMKDNEWYILLSDITLPSMELAAEKGVEQFKPLSVSLAGLDGNNFKIYMSGTYDFADASQIGIFADISDGMIVQNVDICLTGETVFKTNQSGFNVGLLASSNSGVITNADVYSLNGASLSVVCSTATAGAYVAGLVGNNTGHITNSRSRLNLRANVNVGGFVGVNSGVIASSYFKGASLTNQTNTTTEFTAGFAVENSGKIYTSYVSGDPTEVREEEVYYQGTQNSIISSNNITGFVYTNSGSVEDCYSNILLRQSGAFSSGFIFENSGSVKRCFSTSTLESNQTSNYGFLRTNDTSSDEAIVEDCFYLSDEEKKINVSIGTIVQDEKIDIKILDVEGFGNVDNFKNFVLAQGRDISSVWFITRNSGDNANFNNSIFDLNRPELVSANIEATSKRQLDRTESVVDPETGMTSVRYIYTYVTGFPALGSVYNPILISDAQTMEEYIIRENNGAGYNYSYYRIIDNIDYAEYQYNSRLYETKFMGYIEGNFAEINGLSLISSKNLNYAGMFAEVGRTALQGAVGTLMNFTIRPISVSFANANVVGGIVGRLDGGKLINVRVENPSTNNIVVSGTNIVGGAVGLAIGSYKIQNIYSQASAKARNLSEKEVNEFDENSINFEDCSMSGSVAGVLSGSGTTYNVVTDSSVSVLANKAGLMFGLIDGNATVDKVRISVYSDMIVNAHTHGALVVGQLVGRLNDVDVVSQSGDSFKNFMNIPYYATAVGGVVGLMNGGSLSKVSMKQSIQISTLSDNLGVEYLGGVIGVVSNVASISDINVEASFTGFSFVGGVIGGIVESKGQINISGVSFNGMLVAQGHSIKYVGIGGLVGKVGDAELNDNSAFILSKYYDETAQTYKENSFNTTINSTIYTYGESVSLDIGAVVGQNRANGSSSAADVVSRLVSNIETNEMSEQFELTPSSMVVVAGSGESKDSVDTKGTIKSSSITATNCSFYCNVSFKSPNAEGTDIAHLLTVLNIGLADYSLNNK